MSGCHIAFNDSAGQRATELEARRDQLLRERFAEFGGWNAQGEDVVAGTREKYLEAYRLLTGGAPAGVA